MWVINVFLRKKCWFQTYSHHFLCISYPGFVKLEMNVLFFQASDPIPIKKSKHEDFPSQSPLPDKEKQHDWLQSLSASNKVGVASLKVVMMMHEMGCHEVLHRCLQMRVALTFIFGKLATGEGNCRCSKPHRSTHWGRAQESLRGRTEFIQNDEVMEIHG